MLSGPVILEPGFGTLSPVYGGPEPTIYSYNFAEFQISIRPREFQKGWTQLDEKYT